MNDYDYLFKIVMIGDSGVGKSCLMTAYTSGTCDAKRPSAETIGVDFKIKTLKLDGCRLKVQIWDTAGQEKFRTITSCYYRAANGVMVVYDVSDARSFSHVKHWLDEVGLFCDERNVHRILVGNKCDKPNIQRTVSHEDAATYASRLEIDFAETSAYDGTNVNVAFDTLIRRILDAKRTDRQLRANAAAAAAPHKPKKITKKRSTSTSIKLEQTDVKPKCRCK